VLGLVDASVASSVLVIDDFAKQYLHDDLRDVRAIMLWKLEGLSEYDIRRPLTQTGTNLLGLVKHLSASEAWYFGDVFGRLFPGRWPQWNDPAGHLDSMWAVANETRAEIVDRFREAWCHSDATVAALAIAPRAMCPGGLALTSCSSTSSFICSLRRTGTPDTLTSCANNWTEQSDSTPRALHHSGSTRTCG
jgi:hypothetical protein